MLVEATFLFPRPFFLVFTRSAKYCGRHLYVISPVHLFRSRFIVLMMRIIVSELFSRIEHNNTGLLVKTKL